MIIDRKNMMLNMNNNIRYTTIDDFFEHILCSITIASNLINMIQNML